MAYLYGASVQGIQDFIFETNRLREIVGASEIVERICTDRFLDLIDASKVDVVLSAAGNVRIKSESKDALETIVNQFPQMVAKLAPGMTLSQAVVKCGGTEKEDFNKLEQALKIQRNKAIRPTEITALGIERSRRTGKSAVANIKIKKDKRESVDAGTENKIKASKTSSLIRKLKENAAEDDFSNDMEEMTSSSCKWLAVIHADGNSIGETIASLGKTPIKEFSEYINQATIGAARTAFSSAIETAKMDDVYPIRPIVIGGDDLTVVCRADLALDFISEYLTAFQKNGDKYGLTASAGIAFVKESYPFHYAIELAEDLCKVSKTRSREKAGVSFHKIQSSFIDSYDEIKKRELTAGGISLSNSPYYLDELKQLQERVLVVSEAMAPKSGIRKWLSELHRDKNSADQLMDRICEVTKNKYVEELALGEKAIQENGTHLYDVLSIASLTGGE